jgi:glycosyltransferase involved in cell wall biosynthesis
LLESVESKQQISTARAASASDVTIVIPTLNEEGAIGLLIDEIRAQGYDRILVVDGYSTDNTAKIARDRGVQVVKQLGKGKAGAVVIAREVVATPYFLLMDGDYSYDPSDIERFIQHANGYDLIIGFRPKKSKNISRIHRFGNWVLTKSFNILLGSNVPDVSCGMYLMRTNKMKDINLEVHGYDIDQEIAAQMLIEGHVSFVPIRYRERVGKAKAPTWAQGFKALGTIIKMARHYSPIILFSLIAGLLAIPGLFLLVEGLYMYFFLNQYHSGYFLGSLLFFVLGAQGLAVATIAAMFRRLDRKLGPNGFRQN